MRRAHRGAAWTALSANDGAVIPGLYAGWHTAGGSAGDGNAAARPLTGMYADLGLAFVGGYMAAGGIIGQDGVVEG